MSADSIRPSRAWYWVSAAILTGAVACIVLAVVGIVSMIDTVDGFQRVPVPGQAKVSFAEPGGYTLYFEGPGISNASETGTVHIELEPTSPGPSPSLNDYHGHVTYNLAGHQGVAVGTIQIAQPGTYLLSAAEPTRPGVTDIAVGRDIAHGILSSVVLLLTAVLILLPAGLVIGILTLVRRRRARAGQLTAWQGVWPTVAAAAAAGWYPDPARRHQRRLWDGARWTEQVSDHGGRGVDPLGDLSSATATSAGTTPLDSGQPPQDAGQRQE
jgi:Protein of unknown function (DUF2510)